MKSSLTIFTGKTTLKFNLLIFLFRYQEYIKLTPNNAKLINSTQKIEGAVATEHNWSTLASIVYLHI